MVFSLRAKASPELPVARGSTLIIAAFVFGREQEDGFFFLQQSSWPVYCFLNVPWRSLWPRTNWNFDPAQAPGSRASSKMSRMSD